MAQKHINEKNVHFIPIPPEDKKKAVSLLTGSLAENHLFIHFFKKKRTQKVTAFFGLIYDMYIRINGVLGIYTPEGELVSAAVVEHKDEPVPTFREKMGFIFYLGFFPALKLLLYTIKTQEAAKELKKDRRYLCYLCIKKEYRSRKLTARVFDSLLDGYSGLLADTSTMVRVRASSWYGFKLIKTVVLDKIETYFLLKSKTGKKTETETGS